MSTQITTRCSNCQLSIHESYNFPCELGPDGEVQPIMMVPAEVSFDGVRKSKQVCKNCNETVETYQRETDFDALWSVANELQQVKSVTHKSLVELFMQKGLAGTNFVPGREFADYIYYLHDKGVIGPVRHFLFSNYYHVLVDKNHSQASFAPMCKVPVDGSCTKCGKSDFFKVGDTCPRCTDGILEENPDEQVSF